MQPNTDTEIINKLRCFGCKLKNYISKKHGGLILSNMKKLGFEYVYKPDSTVGGIYVNKKLKLVVKENYIVEELDKTEKKDIVPTIFLGRIAIQPLCNDFRKVAKKQDAVKKLRTKVFADVHEGNVMIYNRKPVLVDW
jgi:hypothetical protein